MAELTPPIRFPPLTQLAVAKRSRVPGNSGRGCVRKRVLVIQAMADSVT